MTQAAALKIWEEMTPMERLDVMNAVGYVKSVTKRFRMCIAHIQAGGAE